MMHIASAFNKNIISLWGNTVPELGMYPYGAGDKSKIFEVKNLRCRPCSKIGFAKCPKGHFNCMNNIDEKQVVSYIQSLIE
jgi:ADP-heptose:LPS heptosyltransferase